MKEHSYCKGDRKMMLGGADCYILKDSDGQPCGVLFVELGFDIMKLKDFSITEAIIYLENNEIPFMWRGGIKGTLRFRKQEDIEREKLKKECILKEIEK